MRQYSLLDKVIGHFDTALQTVAASAVAVRDNPGETHAETALSTEEQTQSAGYMRVNHTGEVCAQALYRGQLLAARRPEVQTFLEQAAIEETDHLAWCQDRLRELGSHTSYFNPAWYAMSFTLGAVAGFAGDGLSLGFVEETEEQVGRHLQQHLESLSKQDAKSRAIVEQMYIDEVGHAKHARVHGAKPLPTVIKNSMKMMAKVMKVVAYRF